MEVFTDRLRREQGMDAIVTAPSVVYEYEIDREITSKGVSASHTETERAQIAAPSEFPVQLLQHKQRGSGGWSPSTLPLSIDNYPCTNA